MYKKLTIPFYFVLASKVVGQATFFLIYILLFSISALRNAAALEHLVEIASHGQYFARKAVFRQNDSRVFYQ